MKTKKIGMVLAVSILLVFAGCREKITIPVEELTRDGYFTLRESNEKGRYGPVVVFPERHDSRLIQAEFGWALNILLESCGMNSIALEGMYEGETMTGEKPAYGTEVEKYEALLAVLENGDIKAPEFMYFAKDSFVFGIENEAEYAVTIPDSANMALFQSLLMSVLIDQGREVLEPYLEAEDIDFDAILALNPWTLETYTILSESRSLTEVNGRLTELEEKTRNLLPVESRAGFRELKKFYDAAHQRSYTMAGNVYNRLKKNNKPLAMIIGAAHTEDIAEYFTKKKVRYYVLEPSGLNATGIWSDLTSEEYERKNDGMSVFVNGQISSFFDNGRNPRPTHAKYFVKRQYDFNAVIENVITFVKAPPPRGSFTLNIPNLNGLRVVPESIDAPDVRDIKFCMENSRGERVYVRAVRNILNYRFVSLRKSFEDIIKRLDGIDAQNVSLVEMIKQYAGVIKAYQLKDYTILISPRMDTLFKMDVREIMDILEIEI